MMAHALHRLHSHDLWQKLYDKGCQEFSEHALNKKFEELSKRGYMDYGVSARTGWLTDKGAEVLKSYNL